MSGMDGMALFEHIHRTLPTLPVIILTAHGTIPDAVAAVQRGVFGYLAKPFDSKTLLANISQALRFVPGAVSQNDVSQASWRRNIITQSAVMEDILTKAGLVAEGDASVLIYGESGVGKELFAHAIHEASKRRHHPFVAINCAAIRSNYLNPNCSGMSRVRLPALFGITKDFFNWLKVERCFSMKSATCRCCSRSNYYGSSRKGKYALSVRTRDCHRCPYYFGHSP